MFERAIVATSCRMHQDCDLNRSKPINLMLDFMSIKNEDEFLLNLSVKKIKFRQGEILNCFK